MTRAHASDGPDDVQWLMAEMERAGVTAKARERLLLLLAQVAERRGLKRSELKAALRMHVTSSLLAQCTATEARRRLPALLGVSRSTAYVVVQEALQQRTVRRFAFGQGDDAGA